MGISKAVEDSARARALGILTSNDQKFSASDLVGPVGPPAPPTDYSGQVLALNPAHFWRLGENVGSGTAADSVTTSPVDLTASGAGVFGHSGVLYGDANTAYDNDTGAGYLGSGSGNFVIPTTGDWTLEAWVAVAGGPYIVQGDAASYGLELSIGVTQIIAKVVTTVPSVITNTATVTGVTNWIPTRMWQHIVVVWEEGVGLYIYVNGSQMAFTATTNTSVRSSAGEFRIGADTTGTPRTGWYDEVAIYPSRITPAQIASNYYKGRYNETSPDTYAELILASSPIGYYRMNDQDGSTSTWQFDYSDKRNSGSISGPGGVPAGATGLIVSNDNCRNFTGGSRANAAQQAYQSANWPNFTIEFWIAFNVRSACYVVEFGQSQLTVPYGYATDAFELFINGVIGIDPRPFSQLVVTDTNTHFIAYSYDGANFRSYLDGVKVADQAISFTIPAQTMGLFIGAANNGTNFVNGKIDEVALFDTGLAEAVILSHYAKGAGA